MEFTNQYTLLVLQSIFQVVYSKCDLQLTVNNYNILYGAPVWDITQPEHSSSNLGHLTSIRFRKIASTKIDHLDTVKCYFDDGHAGPGGS